MFLWYVLNKIDESLKSLIVDVCWVGNCGESANQNFQVKNTIIEKNLIDKISAQCYTIDIK